MTGRQRTIKCYFSPYLTQEIFKHVTTCLFWGWRGRSHTYFCTFPECTFVIKSDLSKHYIGSSGDLPHQSLSWDKRGARPYGNLQKSLVKVDDKFPGSPGPPEVYRSVKIEVKRELCGELRLHPLPKAVKRSCHLQTRWESLRGGARGQASAEPMTKQLGMCVAGLPHLGLVQMITHSV